MKLCASNTHYISLLAPTGILHFSKGSKVLHDYRFYRGEDDAFQIQANPTRRRRVGVL